MPPKTDYSVPPRFRDTIPTFYDPYEVNFRQVASFDPTFNQLSTPPIGQNQPEFPPENRYLNSPQFRDILTRAKTKGLDNLSEDEHRQVAAAARIFPAAVGKVPKNAEEAGALVLSQQEVQKAEQEKQMQRMDALDRLKVNLHKAIDPAKGKDMAPSVVVGAAIEALKALGSFSAEAWDQIIGMKELTGKTISEHVADTFDDIGLKASKGGDTITQNLWDPKKGWVEVQVPSTPAGAVATNLVKQSIRFLPELTVGAASSPQEFITGLVTFPWDEANTIIRAAKLDGSATLEQVEEARKKLQEHPEGPILLGMMAAGLGGKMLKEPYKTTVTPEAGLPVPYETPPSSYFYDKAAEFNKQWKEHFAYNEKTDNYEGSVSSFVKKAQAVREDVYNYMKEKGMDAESVPPVRHFWDIDQFTQFLRDQAEKDLKAFGAKKEAPPTSEGPQEPSAPPRQQTILPITGGDLPPREVLDVADQFGLESPGVQYKKDGSVAFYTFRDPKNDGNFSVKGLDQVEEALKAHRQKFDNPEAPPSEAAPEPPATVPPEDRGTTKAGHTLKVGDTVYAQGKRQKKPHKGKVMGFLEDGDGNVTHVTVGFGLKGVDRMISVPVDEVQVPQHVVSMREYHKALAELPPEERKQAVSGAKEFDQLIQESRDLFVGMDDISPELINDAFSNKGKTSGIALGQIQKLYRQAAREKLLTGDLNNPVTRAKALPALKKFLAENLPSYEANVGDLNLEPGDVVLMAGDWFKVEPSDVPGEIKMKDGTTVTYDVFDKLNIQTVIKGPKEQPKPSVHDITPDQIPEGLLIDRTIVRAKTGERAKIKQDAKQAYEELEAQADLYKKLLDCIKGAG